MSLRLFRHTLSQMLCPAAQDQVLSGVQVPSDGKLNNVWGDVHLIGVTPLPVLNAGLYACDGRMLLHQTPDDGATFNALWDANVAKDVDVSSGAIDLNASANTQGFFEPGEPDVHALIDMEISSREDRFYKRRGMISFANSPRGFEAGSPDTFIAAENFKVRSSRSIPVEYWSLAAVAFGTPALDDMTTTPFTTFNDEPFLMQLKYMEVVLEQAWMQLVGLTETGAETPWEDAANMIGDFLEPTVFEVTVGDFFATSYNVLSKFTWDITVPGRMEANQLTAS